MESPQKATSPTTLYDNNDDEKNDLFSKQHVELIFENLISSGKFERLERFLWAIPNLHDYSNNEVVLIAQAYLAFRKGQFDTLYELLQRRVYGKRFHRQLQYLWRTARYIEAEKTKGRALGSVGKYRIRRKFPLPNTIWDGECMSYCFREEAREKLNTSYSKSPYPTAKEKYAIAQDASLTVTQVSNWFKNKRQRARAKSIETITSRETKTEKCSKVVEEVEEEPLKRNYEEQHHIKRTTIQLHKPIPQLPILKFPTTRIYPTYTPYGYKLYQPIIYKRPLPPLIYKSGFTRTAYLPYRSHPYQIIRNKHSNTCNCCCNGSK